ncbi:MAG: hypothetical protein NT062_11850 [Proteobacteria bacterium]|nr:hypothetical protein [Pseudomonadota bacterium]
MGVALETVEQMVTALPGAVVGARWGNRTWMIGGHGFAWHRPFSKADLLRYGEDPPPTGEIFAVIVDGLDAKDALLGMALPGFFTIPHFDGHAAVLIELRLARLADVRAALTAAHRIAAARSPRKTPKPKPTASKRRASKRP